MGEARKIMNTPEVINISEEDRKAAYALLMKSSSISVEQALVQYKTDLDLYCTQYKAPNYQDLITRADELEFDPKVCSDILDKYSFLERHQA